MALREKLDSYNEPIVIGPENDPMTVDAQLAVEAWNRTTVADGAWLQQNAIGPLSARDIVLANAIDDTNDALSALSTQMTGTDGRSLKSINGRFFSAGEAWEGSKDAIVPDGTLVNKDETVYIPKNDEVILSMNDDGGHAFQLQLKPNEIGYRRLAGSNTAEAEGNYGNYKYDTQASEFKPVMLAPEGSGNYLATSAGSWSELKFCEDNFSANDNGEVTIKYMPGNWVKTEDGYAVLPGSEKESFLHGSDVTVASARASTIFGVSFSADGFIDNSLLVGSNNGNVEGNIYHSIANVHQNGKVGNADCSIFSLNDGSYASSINTSILLGDDGFAFGRVENSIVLGDDGDIGRQSPNVADSIVHMCNGVYSVGSASNISYTIGSFSRSCSAEGSLASNILNVNRAAYVKNMTDSIGWIGNNSTVEEKCDRSIVQLNNTSRMVKTDSSLVMLQNSGYLIGANNSMLNLSNGSSITGADSYLAVGLTHGMYDAKCGISVGDYIQVKGCYNILNVGSGCSAYVASNSILLGNDLKTVKPYTVNIGRGNSAEGEGAWTIGTYNLVTTDHTHYLFGNGNRGEDGDYSMVVGNGNYNRGSYNAIHGNELSAHGSYNLFAGSGSIAYSDYSLGVGNDIYLHNGKSIAIGDHLKTTNTFQLLLGQYAVSYTDSVLEVGLGTPENTKTVFRIDRNGNVFMTGSLVCGNIQCGVITSGRYPDTMNGGPWTP